MKFCQLLVSPGSAATNGHVQARQRTHAVDAIGVTLGFVVGRFQIAPGLYLFTDVVSIARRIESRRDRMSGGVHDSDAAVVESEAAIRFYDGHKQRWKVAEGGDFFGEFFA